MHLGFDLNEAQSRAMRAVGMTAHLKGMDHFMFTLPDDDGTFCMYSEHPLGTSMGKFTIWPDGRYRLDVKYFGQNANKWHFIGDSEGNNGD